MILEKLSKDYGNFSTISPVLNVHENSSNYLLNEQSTPNLSVLENVN